MKNVLVITPFIWEGGPWRGKRTVYAILQGFQRAGYDVHVVTATNRPGLHEDDWQGLHIHYFHPAVAAGGGEFDAFHSFLSQVAQGKSPWRRHLNFRLFWLSFVWGAERRAREVARQHPPAFLYGVNNPGIPPAWRVARALGVPFFSRIMGSYLPQRSGSRLLLYLARFDELLAFKLPATALIVTEDGQASAQDIHQRLGAPLERIWLFRNGIDKAVFQQGGDKTASRKALGMPQNAKIILWVAQLVPIKHPERLLNALPDVLAQAPHTHVVIVGDGPVRDEMTRLASALGVADAVRFEGFVDRSVLPTYFQAADVFIALSDYGNIGNSTLEAMLSGLPVVALDNGHTAEVVRHRETGLLVPPDQLQQLPDALLTLLQDDALRAQMGADAARYTDKILLTWEERIDREITQIESIIESGDKSS
ncbi:MAG: hypothetical protein DSY55_01790 [Clostridia bacterium]|nr:MAG: hypothetical protein DSY55_01790 [Clostridia bacterium]